VTKLQWESLLPGRVAAIEEVTGPVVKAESAAGGLMPGLAAVVHAANGRYFVKAVPAGSPRRTAHVATARLADRPARSRHRSRGPVDHVPRVQGYLRPQGCPRVPDTGRSCRAFLGRVPDALTSTDSQVGSLARTARSGPGFVVTRQARVSILSSSGLPDWPSASYRALGALARLGGVEPGRQAPGRALDEVGAAMITCRAVPAPLHAHIGVAQISQTPARSLQAPEGHLDRSQAHAIPGIRASLVRAPASAWP
jgi:hypothetical protein